MILCTSTLPHVSFEQSLEIASWSGCHGIELRVADAYHRSVDDLAQFGQQISKTILGHGLYTSVLNSYVPLEERSVIEKLIHASQSMEVQKIRIVLPLASNAMVAGQSRAREVVPSYRSVLPPRRLIDTLRRQLGWLERAVRRTGIQVLLELHWGTVMSSFSSAHMLMSDCDPKHIAVTFDPANMVVEGKEDWEFGLTLMSEYIANVHVKNVAWRYTDDGWVWEWASLNQGMLDWQTLVQLLKQIGYAGEYAIEDFRVPSEDVDRMINHIRDNRFDFEATRASVFRSEEYELVESGWQRGSTVRLV